MAASWLGMGVAWLTATTVWAQQGPSAPAMLPSGPSPMGSEASVFSTPQSTVPIEQLPAAIQSRVLTILQQPTLRAHGPTEAFLCQPSLYYWMVDHPDQTARLWLALGARCAGIEGLGDGHFRWRDSQLGEMYWDTVLRTSHQCIWYAQGKVRPGPLLPSVTVRALAILNFVEGTDSDGRPAIRQQMDLLLQANSHAVALATRLFGASAPHMVEQYVGQLQTFFGALSWYLSKHPEKAESLFNQVRSASHQVPAGSVPQAFPSARGGS